MIACRHQHNEARSVFGELRQGLDDSVAGSVDVIDGEQLDAGCAQAGGQPRTEP